MYQKKLGAKLRELRVQLGLSIRTLATRTGFSPSFISQLEADIVSPSISSLERITSELGVTLGQLFSSMEHEPRVIMRQRERMPHHSAWGRSTVESLNDLGGGRRLSAILVTFEPEGSSGKHAAPARSETFATVVRGTLSIDTEDVTTQLATGDTVYLPEGTMFRLSNSSDEEGVLLMVSLVGRDGQGAI